MIKFICFQCEYECELEMYPALGAKPEKCPKGYKEVKWVETNKYSEKSKGIKNG